jgi:hypothetical protein
VIESDRTGDKQKPVRVLKVAVKKGDDFVPLPVGEFVALPLSERMSLVLRRAIRFYDGNGQEIPLQEGVRSLREAQGSTTSRGAELPRGKAEMSLKAFRELAVNERLSLLLDGRALFRNERGEEIPTAEALQKMRDMPESSLVGISVVIRPA